MNTTKSSISSIAADTFHDATARRRMSVKMAWEEVTQMKNRKITVPWESRFLAGLVDDVPATQEHRRFEQSVCDEMEDGQRESAQSTFHNHVTHLADRRETERL